MPTIIRRARSPVHVRISPVMCPARSDRGTRSARALLGARYRAQRDRPHDLLLLCPPLRIRVADISVSDPNPGRRRFTLIRAGQLDRERLGERDDRAWWRVVGVERLAALSAVDETRRFSAIGEERNGGAADVQHAVQVGASGLRSTAVRSWRLRAPVGRQSRGSRSAGRRASEPWTRRRGRPRPPDHPNRPRRRSPAAQPPHPRDVSSPRPAAPMPTATARPLAPHQRRRAPDPPLT